MSTPARIQPEIVHVLKDLRSRIRRYVLLEGVALVLVVLAALFWLTLALDVAYFRASNLDLPRWFRMAVQISVACTAVLSFSVWVALRLLRRLRTRALALVLERRFPQLDDRLILAVEAADDPHTAETPLSSAMLQRTIREVAQSVRQLDLSEVFNRVPLVRAALTAVVLVTSIGVFGITNADAMQRWARAYLRLDENYWDRQTLLQAHVVAQPGDVEKPFVEYEDRFEYKHPRGTDLTLVAQVPDSRRPDGQAWRTPDSLQIEMRESDGSGNGVRKDSLPARHTIPQLQDDLDIWIRGGDFINRKPYHIKVVDQPRVDDMELYCSYPQYTGLNQTAGRRKPIQGADVALPLETGFVLNARCNKELVRVRILTEPELFELDFSLDAGQLVVLHDDGRRDVFELSPALRESLFPNERHGFRIPMFMGLHSKERLAELAPDFQEIPLPPETLLRIYLEDTDDVVSLDPTRLTVRGIPDLPPEFHDVARYGVGSSITRKAVVPLTGMISDDFGIETARFEYQIDHDGEWKPRPFRNVPVDDPREFRLEREAGEPFEQFEVLPLDLTIGQKLTLTIYAVDGDNLNGPHGARAQTFEFTIVTDEELLSLLYEREINLRQRLEQIIRELKDKRTELLRHAELEDERVALLEQPDSAAAQIQEIGNTVRVCAERSLHDLAKNQNETEAIRHSFEEILLELVNNAVHSSQMVERLDQLIVRPLIAIDEQNFPAVSTSLYRMKEACDAALAGQAGKTTPSMAIDQSVLEIDALVEGLEQVLAEIKDLAEFHETLQDLKNIIEKQQELSKRTKEEQKRRFIENLQKLNDLN